VANFVRVDATQPLDKVLADVEQHILKFHATRSSQKITVSGQAVMSDDHVPSHKHEETDR
jgi:hypothetical protein